MTGFFWIPKTPLAPRSDSTTDAGRRYGTSMLFRLQDCQIHLKSSLVEWWEKPLCLPLRQEGLLGRILTLGDLHQNVTTKPLGVVEFKTAAPGMDLPAGTP